MKRDPALVSLSHDHHQALFVAQAPRRANADTAADARAAFLTYWNAHGRTHFRLEEDHRWMNHHAAHRMGSVAAADAVKASWRTAALAPRVKP